MLGHKSFVVTNSRASVSINNYGILCHIYFASEVVSMEVEQAHFDEFFEVHRTMHIHIIFSVSIHVYVCMYVRMYCIYHIKAGLKYMQGLKYMLGSAAK